MVATAVSLLANGEASYGGSAAVSRAVVAVVVLFVLQAATGALISVRSAGAACAVACDIVWLPGAARLFDPPQAGSAIDLLRNTAGGQPLQAIHRLGGIALALIALSVALAVVRERNRALVPLLVATPLLGTAIAANDGAVVAVAAHAAAAALAVGLLAAALVRARVLKGKG